MTVKRIWFAIALVLTFGTMAKAQAAQIAWTAPIEAQTAAEAAGYIYTFYVNRLAVNPPAPTVLTGVTCTPIATTTTFDCRAPIPAGLVLVVGQRWELTAKTATSNESGFSVPFSLSLSAPTVLRRQ